MKKSLLLLVGFIILSCISCTKEKNIATSLNSNESDRLVFKNFEEFNDTYLTLTKFRTNDELSFWAHSKNHSTLLYSLDSTIVDYSEVLKTILNKDFEFELGDSIVLFNNGTLYAYSKNEADQITLEDNPEKFRNIGVVTLNSIGRSTEKSIAIIPLSGGLNADNQQEFQQESYLPCGEYDTISTGGTRKFVHELYSEEVNNVYYVYLRIKLEYKGSRWRPAGEPQRITFGLNGSAYLTNTEFGRTFNFTSLDIFNEEMYTCLVGPLSILLCYSNISEIPTWTVNMSGYIDTRVVGDRNRTLGEGIFHDENLWHQ
ncbi:MAG: hypothetical protein LLG13_03765 [Bacteroidales bacterium]|nr:hypothetical protein [Bacteroidales bacterium]